MRVLVLTKRLSRGGAAKLIYELAISDMPDDVGIDIAVMSRDIDIYSELLTKNGVNVQFVEFKSILSLSSIIRLARLFKLYDIVHVHLFPAFYVAAIAKYFSRSNNIFVYTEHNTHNRRRSIGFFYYIERVIYGSYDAVVCISQPVARSLESWMPPVRDKIHVIDNGVDVKGVSVSAPADDILDLKKQYDDPVLVLMAGAFEFRKDHRTLVAAIARLPVKFHLVLAGEGRLKASVQDYARELGVDSRVHFLGFRKDMASVMKACDVYVQSSSWEGFGLVAVEAMASQLPVVASDVEGLADVVGDAGLLFPPGDASTLSECIEEAWASSEPLVIKGSQRALLYDSSVFVDKHVDLYRSLIQ